MTGLNQSQKYSWIRVPTKMFIFWEQPNCLIFLLKCFFWEQDALNHFFRQSTMFIISTKDLFEFPRSFSSDLFNTQQKTNKRLTHRCFKTRRWDHNCFGIRLHKCSSNNYHWCWRYLGSIILGRTKPIIGPKSALWTAYSNTFLYKNYPI